MRMKNSKFLLVVLSFVLLLSACEEVIQLDLNTADEKFVIEANLTNQANGVRIAISKTKSYASANEFKGVSGAVVEIIDDQGSVTRITESATKGVYANAILKGLPTKTYQLNVVVEGQTFTASSTMPTIVRLDDVYQFDLNLFDGPRTYTHVRYSDPESVKNFYRFLEYKNNVYTKSIIVSSDEFTDGQLVNRALFPFKFDDETRLNKGDKIKVEFLTINEPMYKYWFSVKDGAQRTGDSAAPANPVTNLKGGAIGYFSAHTIQTASYTVN